jgi:EAL and modified HD-GYP domain-containing signal transduction protein
MVPNPAIGNTLMGYEPIVDRARKAIAMRITARGRAGAAADLTGLYNDFRMMWPDGSIPVLIRNEGNTLPSELIELESSRQVWLEVPVSLVESAEGAELITHLHRRGFVLVLGGRPSAALPGNLLPSFRMSIIDFAEDRRLRDTTVERQRAHHRTIPYAQAGVKSIAMLKRSFDTGAVACIGWPFDDALQHAVPSDSNPDFGTITQLLSMIERDADASDLEKVIRRDAALAYRLLRYINSAAFGLTVEIQSFRHAVMMLGYERLKRWLLLMLMTASKDANMQPVMFASFRRGLFMENLVGEENEETMRDEVFILGVLSLLDKLFREPLPQLLEKLYVPDSIREALIARTGPYVPYLGIAESVEHPPDAELADRIDNAFLSIEQCNRALVKAVTVREVAAA